MTAVVTGLVVLGSALAGAALWGLVEYLLHRFAMHHLGGRGILSREHLEHHVKASWSWSPIFLASWAGVVLVGYLGWGSLGWLLVGGTVGLGLGTGWTLGYAFYEHQHAVAHLRAPAGRYGSWLRRHHFHHHFGHPMANHGVTSPLWDHVFGTWERPERVRVPRRLAMRWLVDEHGEVREEHRPHYELVGAADREERLDALDRARAFASLAPLH